MFKKALQIAASFGLLAGAYVGYVRLFAVATRQLGELRTVEAVPFPEVDSKWSQKANELARESFGPGHFAARDDLKLQHYDAERGLFMYAQDKEISKDGKRIKVWPFALIWVSKDGKSRKTATSDEAIIDLSQPFMTAKQSAGPSKVTHAQLLGDVRLGDDKGTRDDPSDDLRVGPLSYLEFDDQTLQITTDSDIFLQDRDLTLWGVGMKIQLRRKVAGQDPGAAGGGGSGFDAETAFVYKDVHIVVNDVRSNGILPGAAKPEKAGKTPIDVRSDREMRIDLPRPRPPVLVGPPDLNRPPDPTFVKFKTNVRVERGTDKSDRLISDTLDLTLLPDTRPPEEADDPAGPGDPSAIVGAEWAPTKDGPGPAEAVVKPASTGGPLTELKIRTALARGDAVWLLSEAQGLVARCSELKYEKHGVDGLPDVTYLNGGSVKRLMVERVEYDDKAPTPNTIKSVMRLTSLDATIFDFGPGGTSKVIARGPGKTEERPARNASIAREVWFEDEMELLTWKDGQGPVPPPSALAVRSQEWAKKAFPVPPPQGTLRRLITLTGVSKLIDHNSATTLDARKSIVAEFQAGPKTNPTDKDGPTQIKWLDAFEDAHLTAPSRSLTARQFLKAKFDNPPAPRPAPGAVAPGPLVAMAPAPPPPPTPEVKPEPAPAPVEPLVDGRADRVWATVLLGSANPSAGNVKGELKFAQLRGGVMVHQDPAPGKPYPNEASGEALDLTGQGNGLMKFAVQAEEPPLSADPKTRLASDDRGRRAPTAVPARVEFEGKTIESADVIGLDQKLDLAWVQGPGIFIQMADRGLLDDKGIEGEGAHLVAKPNGPKPSGPNPKDRLVISWNEEMRFYGKSKDLEGRPSAKIEFRGSSKEVRTPTKAREFRRGVEAKMTDSAIFCDTMDVYMDRTIDFNKDTRKPAANADDPKPTDPQIAMLDCKGNNILEQGALKLPGVDIISQKLFPESGEVKEKQRIQGTHVLYDKRTGNFHAPGPGMVWLLKRKGGDPKAEPPTTTALPVANPSNGRGRPEPSRAAMKLTGLELTKIRFDEGMQGRFGVAKDQPEDERRDAEFYGAVQAANASVAGKAAFPDIDFDNLDKYPDSVFLTSDRLNVFSYPAPVGSKVANRQLLDARGNGVARRGRDMVQAGRITYNSLSGLIYGYGDDDKEVSMTKQDSAGQRPTTTRGKMVRYNRDTRAFNIDDPHAMSFTDLKSGVRPKPYFPDLGGTPRPPDPAKAARLPLQRSSRNSTERNSFTGH